MYLRILNYFLLILNILIALALVLGILSPFFSPMEFWAIAFFGLSFPFVFALNFLILIFWLIRKSKFAWISGGVILLSLPNVPAFLQVGYKEAPITNEAKLLNVVSFNTHYMGAYDFRGGDSSFFFNLLDTIKPDVICLQEFANLGGNYEKPMFKKFFNQYKSFANVNADLLSNTFPTGYGVCIFSKHLIVNKGFLELENQNSNLSVFADILFGKDTIRIVNTHLKSIVFDREDYKTIETLKEAEEGPQTYQLRRIVAKLKYAFQYRAKQADKIREKLENCPYKVVFCGDFNDSPTSYSYHTIRGKMKDSFKESGYGMSRTYIGKMPSFRIDYILHDASWKSYEYRTNTVNFSDHKMISCRIAIP
ncbi:MAG: endonuclease/exonuclease/phosphatase family protein [bacterium]|nr:endonuclease/exonuclease/phosphatase family protein [bacterium]